MGYTKKQPVSPNNQQTSIKPATQEKGQLMTLNDLLASGKSQKCTVAYSLNNTQNQATVYIDGGNTRMDTTYELNGAVKNFSVISDGKNVYLWTNDSKYGYKTTVQKNSTSTPPSSGSTLRQDLDPNHQYQYDCSGQAVDPSEFTPPSSINFSALSTPQSPTTGAAGAPTEDKAKACAACDYAGSGKAQCLASLGCN
jgi:hypothetical protein